MTDKEKKENPNFKTRNGYLRTIDYKEAWEIAYDNASDKEIELLKKLPNFDAEVFKEITGIDVSNKIHTIEIDGKKIELSEESFNSFKQQFIDNK